MSDNPFKGSDTPRTDEVWKLCPPADYGGFGQMWGHAKQLERELNQWKQVAEILAGHVQRIAFRPEWNLKEFNQLKESEK